MAPITLTTNKERRGPCLLLDFTLNCVQSHRNEIKSKALQIDRLGMIQFHFIHENNDNSVTALYATKAYNSANGTTVKMNVMSTALNYSGESVCAKDWSQRETIGKLPGVISCNDAILYQLKLNVTVAKKDSKLHLYDKFYRDTAMVDFRLSAADGSGYVGFHKLILSTGSEVFKTLFENDWKQSVEGQIDVKEATVSTLKYLKDYLHMGILPDAGLRPLLLIARRYVMSDLKKECIKKIVDTVTNKNLFAVIEFACKNNIPELAFAIVVEAPNNVVHAVYESRKNGGILERDL